MIDFIASILRFYPVYKILFVEGYKHGLKIKRGLEIKGIG